MPDFSKNLFDFYRFISPVDSFGKFTIDASIGPGKEKDKKPLLQVVSDNIKKKIIDEFTSGAELVKLKNYVGQFNKPSAPLNPNQEEYVEVIKGSYNVVYQASGSPSAEFLYKGYFSTYPAATAPQGSQKKPANTEVKVSVAPSNYWANVCDEIVLSKTPPPPPTPPIDFSMIFLRAPMLTKITQNTEAIQLYLTAMPPLFANQLMPYCDVEFQLPTLDTTLDGNPIESNKVNRPSLYRFLMGSGQDLSKLTEADKSIANVLSPSRSDKKNAEKDGVKAKNQTFFGMEMFTSPQTLVNMDVLKQSTTQGASRLNDAKPFLPPATLKDVGITIQNAGAGAIGRRSASLKLQVHDRKRLAEMGEFLRGSDGYAKSTVWITYGMLAPRGRDPDDAYAKFINENMLVREAFVISNSQFTFTPDGGCEVTLTMSAKGGTRGLSTPITFSELDLLKRKIDQLIKNIKSNIGAFGSTRDENAGFDKKEIRMAQFIASAAEGTIPTSKEDVDAIKKEVEAVKKLIAAGGQNRGPGFNKDTAIKMLDDLKGAVETRAHLKETGKTFITRKFEKFNEINDPFLPDARKNDVQLHTATSAGSQKAAVATAAGGSGIVYYNTVLCAAVKEKNKYISFGRVFSALCAPALINAIADEFDWNVDQLTSAGGVCPYEVQIIFYQLNSKCGPVSLHNVAEFPFDKAMFVDAFSRLIETTGGEAINLEIMLNFINGQLGDPRQPGYARNAFYKPFVAPKDDATSELEALGQEGDLAKKLADWGKNYGDFVTPSLTFELEVCQNTGGGSSDLLIELSGKIAAGYTTPVIRKASSPDNPVKKTILKYHIYDRTSNPMDKITKSLRLAKDGTYYFVSSEHGDDKDFLEKLQATPNVAVADGQAVSIGQGKEALLEYLGQIVPRIVIGTEGSLISQVSLQSKTSGLEGTIALQGGTQKRSSELADTGLSQVQFNMPMILYPAQLTMNTLGCPLVSIGQHFFIDFGTNTTLDNEYIVTQVSHTFGQGKFDSSWTLCYYDGYGRMMSGNDITGQLEALAAALAAAQSKPAQGPGGPAPNTEADEYKVSLDGLERRARDDQQRETAERNTATAVAAQDAANAEAVQKQRAAAAANKTAADAKEAADDKKIAAMERGRQGNSY